MSSGGKSGSSAVVGYRYYLGVHIVFCYGPVDSVRDLIASDRSVGFEQGLTLTGATVVNGSDRITWSYGQPNPLPGEMSAITGPGIRSGTYISGAADIGGGRAVGYLRSKSGGRSTANNNLINATLNTFYPLSQGITYSRNIYINRPDLFGGDQREGGLAGSVDVMMGENTQQPNSYLTQFLGVKTPAYRGVTSLVFRRFFWTSGSPYFKPIWGKLTRILKGWENDAPWYPAKAVINTLDMNPAHIIYESLTNKTWGMGYNTTDIDDVSFTLAADTLFTEGFGLSIAWSQQTSINDFIKLILNHINGTLRLDLSTGKFLLKLIRADYVIGNLTALNEDNVLEIKSFQRAAYGELANEVVVEHLDRMGNTKTVAVQDLASVLAQGEVISTTRQYHGISDPDLAARVAMRDLQLLSMPLAKLSLTANRVLWDKEVGDVVALHWANLYLVGVPFRILKIDKGTHQDGRISVDMVEDVFGLPASAYTKAPDSQWTNTVQVDPVPAANVKGIELPFWEIDRSMTRADIAQLQSMYGFSTVLATRGVGNTPYQYTLSSSSDNVNYSDKGVGHFCPTAELAIAVSRIDTQFSISNFYDLSQAILDDKNGYAYIDDEVVAVVSIDDIAGQVIVRRGCLDTVPVEHAIGARMYFVLPSIALDQTERVSGELVYYKPRPTTGKGTLLLTATNATNVTLNNRASRPYPPGNFKINGQYFPTSIIGPMSVTWSNRDRTQQTVSLIDFTQGNIGPETGTIARLRLYNGQRLVREYVGKTGFNYTATEQAADGNITPLRLVLDSVTYQPFKLLNGVYTREYLSVLAQEPTPTDMYLRSGSLNLYVVGAGNKVFQYDIAAQLDVSSATWSGKSLDVSQIDNQVKAITFSDDGKILYVLGSQHAAIGSYYLMTPWDIATAVIGTVFNGPTLIGIDFNTNGTMMYLYNVMTKTVEQYRCSTPWEATGATLVFSSPMLNAQEPSITGGCMSSGGDRLFMIGAGNKVYEYILASPWDISTVTYSGVNFSVTAQTLIARDVAFKKDGLKMWIAETGYHPIYEYTLTVPYDLTTATFTATHLNWAAVPGYVVGGGAFVFNPFSVAPQDTDPRAVCFGDKGRMMYIAGAQTGKVYQYTLLTAYRADSAVYSGVMFSAIDTTIQGLSFSSDGLILFTADISGKIRSYALPNAWSLSGAAYTGEFIDSAAQDSSVVGSAFDADGLNVLALGSTTKTVYQYAMYKSAGVESLQKHDWTVSRTF